MLLALAATALAADSRSTPSPTGGAATASAPRGDAATTQGASAADAAKGPGFALPRHVIAGGGGSSSGGAFAITGTIGQPDADPLHPATGGVFAITGGFWLGTLPAPPLGDTVFASGFEPNAP